MSSKAGQSFTFEVFVLHALSYFTVLWDFEESVVFGKYHQKYIKLGETTFLPI